VCEDDDICTDDTCLCDGTYAFTPIRWWVPAVLVPMKSRHAPSSSSSVGWSAVPAVKPVYPAARRRLSARSHTPRPGLLELRSQPERRVTSSP